jgi:hypothetical protein
VFYKLNPELFKEDVNNDFGLVEKAIIKTIATTICCCCYFWSTDIWYF